MDKRLEAIFKGRVQGVGFRFTTHHISQKFQLTGFVQNLPSGDVRIVAEGEEAELSAFLLAIRTSSMKDHIHDFEVTWKESQGEFSEFSVRAGGE